METIVHHGPVPIRETVLPSGLAVFTATTDSAFVRAQVVVHAGGLDDDPLPPGTAHFFEHLHGGDNSGSVHRAERRLERRGISTGASTTWLATRFYAEGYARDVSSVIRSTGERAFAPDFSPDTLEHQRRVVLQEESSKGGKSDRYDRWIRGLRIPNDRTVLRPLIGTPEGIRSITVDDLRSFHSRWYAGANAALVVSGGIQHERVVGYARRIEALAGGDRHPKMEESPAEVRRETFRGGHNHWLHLYFPCPSRMDPSDACHLVLALDILKRMVFGRVRTSRSLIYDTAWNLVNGPGSCVEARAYCSPESFEEVEALVLRAVRDARNGRFARGYFDEARAISLRSALRSDEAERNVRDPESLCRGMSSAWLAGKPLALDPYAPLVGAASRHQVVDALNRFVDPEHLGVIRKYSGS